MCSVILKRRFERSVYELPWSVLNHGVGHEYVFQWGIAVKRWSAESVCRLSPAIKSLPEMLWCLPFLIATLVSCAKQQVCDHTGVRESRNLVAWKE